MRTLSIFLSLLVAISASAEDLGKQYADQAWSMYDRLQSGETKAGDSYYATIELFNEAAAYGNKDVYNIIGYIYQHQAPVYADGAEPMTSKEYATLIENYYNKAIANGSLNAIYNLATCYHHTNSRTGFESDFDKALALYRMGANQGNAFCLTELGLLYKDRSIPSNDKYPEVAAYECFSKAYENQPDNCPAICLLAECYENGYGVRRDETKAFNLYLEGSEYHYYAAAKVGLFYEEGRVVEKDLQKAYEYYDKAIGDSWKDEWIMQHAHHVAYLLGKEDSEYYIEVEAVSAQRETK